jgi:hypothetical protein
VALRPGAFPFEVIRPASLPFGIVEFVEPEIASIASEVLGLALLQSAAPRLAEPRFVHAHA